MMRGRSSVCCASTTVRHLHHACLPLPPYLDTGAACATVGWCQELIREAAQRAQRLQEMRGDVYVDTTQYSPTSRASVGAGHDGALVVGTAGTRRPAEEAGGVEPYRPGAAGRQDYAGAVLCLCQAGGDQGERD